MNREAVVGDPLFSVVVPIYQNEASLPELLTRLAQLAGELPGELEVIFVVDGSPDGSYRVLQQALPHPAIHAQLIALSRNFGSFAAIRTGLASARGEYLAVMAADLQEPISLIREFFRLLHGREADVTVGVRVGRDDPRLSRWASGLFWRGYRRFVQPEVPEGGVDVFGCTADVRDALLRLEESHSSLVGLLLWVGFRRAEVPYRREARRQGASGWSWRRKYRYMLDSVFSFTDLPITMLIVLGAVGVAVSTLVGSVVLVSWAMGRIQAPGYTALMLTVLFFSSVLLVGLGVVGSYVWRTYENSKARPSAVPMVHDQYPRHDGASETPRAT